jgi:hypothetical protein
MSILDQIRADYKNWTLDKKPGLTIPMAGFGFEDDINQQIEDFNKGMEIILQSDIHLKAYLPWRLHSAFNNLYEEVKGVRPFKVTPQDDHVKQSVSITILIENMSQEMDRNFAALMAKCRDDYSIFPFETIFASVGFCQWQASSAPFGFYLLKNIQEVTI